MTLNGTHNGEDEFSLEDKGLQIVTSIGYILISIFGVVGNGLVLAIVIFVPALRNITNIFIANQSLADFSSSFLLPWAFLLPPLELSGIASGRHGLASILCVVWNSRFLYWSSLKVSTANLLCLTLERFFAVVFPFTYRERMNLKRASFISLGVWMVGFSVELPFASLHYVSSDGVCLQRERSERLSLFFACFLLLYSVVVPCSVMVFVYISILRKLRNRMRKVRDTGLVMTTMASLNTETVEVIPPRNPSERTDTNLMERNQRSKSRARRNVMVTMLTVCLFYAVCVTPNQVYFFLINLGVRPNLPRIVHVTTVLLYACNMCINPIIYACKYKKFQLGIRVLFCKSKPHLIVE